MSVPVHAGMPAWGGVYLVHAGIHTPLPPWTEFLTHACENITFPQLLMRTVIIIASNQTTLDILYTAFPLCVACDGLEVSPTLRKLFHIPPTRKCTAFSHHMHRQLRQLPES